MIRVAAHEGDGAAVWIGKHAVTGQQDPSAVRSCSPVRHRAAWEVPTGLVECQSFGDGFAAGPGGDVRIVASQPSLVCFCHKYWDATEPTRPFDLHTKHVWMASGDC